MSVIRKMRRDARARGEDWAALFWGVVVLALMLTYAVWHDGVEKAAHKRYIDGVHRYEEDLRADGAPENYIAEEKWNYRPEMYEGR